jgi:hypothetical protein
MQSRRTRRSGAAGALLPEGATMPEGAMMSDATTMPDGTRKEDAGESEKPVGGERQGGLTDQEKLANVIRLAFGGDRRQYESFCESVRRVIPDDTRVVLRGSAVTGQRWKDGAPFDADGPGTSDLDLTLVGEAALGFFKVSGFFVPGVHSRPLSDEDPDIAPGLVPLRQELMTLVRRPVNIQASRDIVIQFRGDLLGQPYLLLIGKEDAP